MSALASSVLTSENGSGKSMMLEGCREGRHKECKQTLQKGVFDPKNKWVLLDEFYVCKCSKRGCPCFVKATERNKKVRKRKS